MGRRFYLKGRGDVERYIRQNAKRLFVPHSVDPEFPLCTAVESHLASLEHSEPIELSSTEGGAFIEESSFDSAALRMKVFRLIKCYPTSADPKNLDGLVRELTDSAKRAFCELMIARVDAQDMALVQAFERSSYVACDVLVTYSLKPREVVPADVGDLELRDGRVNDADWMARISAEAFSFSHYFNSPWVNRRSAEEVVKKWINNSIVGYADRVLIAEREGKPVGYITVRSKSVCEGYKMSTIDLIAVDQSARGQGVGRILTSTAIATHKEEVSSWYVGTQAQNSAACRMYESVGFRQASLSATFHKLLGEKVP